ncbi:uncharacterized protein JCM15063_000276 [Sporobolomyces koalae]|uniref:uncharacterized protein n=1 Tax=Sporobolomyces koalae TaxID=500713 RepID=UPI003180826E
MRRWILVPRPSTCLGSRSSASVDQLDERSASDSITTSREMSGSGAQARAAAGAVPSTSPSRSPPPARPRPVDPAPPKYTPYKFEPPEPRSLAAAAFALDLEPSTSTALEMQTDSNGAGPLLLAALESMADSADAASDQGASSHGQGQSLSPKSSSNISSERTSNPSSAGAADFAGDATKGSAYAAYSAMVSLVALADLSAPRLSPSTEQPPQQTSAYSHPVYTSLQHPLYSRPLVPAPPGYPSSAYSLPPINRSSYAPYNYHSPYSRPLSSGGPNQTGSGGPMPNTGNTTLPPMNVSAHSTMSDPAYRGFQPSSSTGPAPLPSYGAPPSLNPYNHPTYGSAAAHTYQHPAYGRASLSSASGQNPGPGAGQGGYSSAVSALTVQPSGGPTNPYSHPSLPPPNPSVPLSAPNSAWSGPPPPPLSMSSGALLAKRRRSETAGSNPNSVNNRGRADHGTFEEQDGLEDEQDERSAAKASGWDGERDEDEDGLEEEDDENPEDEDDLAPQVKSSRPTKRSRTVSAKSEGADAKPAVPNRSKSGANSAEPNPANKAKASPRVRTKPTKSREPPEKKFTCPHPACGRAFARQFNLNSHIKSHQGIREFKCPECNKLFSRKHDCTRHCIAIHHYDKDSGQKGPIHEPTDPPRDTRRPPAPSSPSLQNRPLPPATSLLYAAGQSTSNSRASQTLAMLLQPPAEGTASTSQPSEAPAATALPASTDAE